MKIIIREFQPEDEQVWRELWAGYLDYYRMDLPDEITTQTWQRLLRGDSGIYGLAAVNAQGDMLGIVHYLFHPVTWADGPRCYLEDLYTSETARNRGVGRALIEAVYDKAREKDADQVYWLTENFNERAHYLYDKVAIKTPFIKYQKTL